MVEADKHSRETLRDILAFYRDSGVDVCLTEHEVDRIAAGADNASAAAGVLRALARRQPSPRAAAPAAPRTGTPPATPITASEVPEMPATVGAPGVPLPAATISHAGMAARELAGSAQSLAELKSMLEEFDGCGLKKTATNLVFADGNPEGRVMLVGEAPGREEDRMGLPFVGRSGQLLDRMLAAIGLDRTSVYIANAVPWRPPGNRTPTPEETEICRPFIERQITLADPDFLIPLGSPSAKMLFQTTTGITRLRGQWRRYTTGSREIDAMASLHPAYLLRQPLQKRLAWRDILALKSALDGGDRH